MRSVMDETARIGDRWPAGTRVEMRIGGEWVPGTVVKHHDPDEVRVFLDRLVAGIGSYFTSRDADLRRE